MTTPFQDAGGALDGFHPQRLWPDRRGVGRECCACGYELRPEDLTECCAMFRPQPLEVGVKDRRGLRTSSTGGVGASVELVDVS